VTITITQKKNMPLTRTTVGNPTTVAISNRVWYLLCL
jgi:hypothetical protein